MINDGRPAQLYGGQPQSRTGDAGHLKKLKKDKKTSLPYGPPEIYPGVYIRRHKELEDYTHYFSYLNNEVAKVKKKLMDHERELNAKQQSPFISVYFLKINM